MSLPALGRWAPLVERGPSLESIYRVSLTVDLGEGNKIISFKNLFHHSQLGAPQKEKKSVGPAWARAYCPVCPLVKTALGAPLDPPKNILGGVASLPLHPGRHQAGVNTTYVHYVSGIDVCISFPGCDVIMHPAHQ